MGGTRALLTIKLPDGKVAYYNDRKLAEQATRSLTVVGPVVHDGKTATPLGFPPDEIMQRLAVIETGLRMQQELATEVGVPPPLSAAIQALRILNKAGGDAKHSWHAELHHQHAHDKERDEQRKQKNSHDVNEGETVPQDTGENYATEGDLVTQGEGDNEDEKGQEMTDKVGGKGTTFRPHGCRGQLD